MGKPSTISTAGTGTTNSTGTNLPPQWYQNAFQNILGGGNDVYGGQLTQTMGLTPDQINASMITNAALQNFMSQPQVPAYDVFGMGQNWNQNPIGVPQMPALFQGGVPQATAQQATAQQAAAAQAQAAQLKPSEIAPFMNPYIDTALNPALNRLRQQQAEVQAGIGGQAAAANMFGGSREAVQRMLADRNYRDTLANTAGNMLNQGFQQASGLAGQNTGWQQQTNLTNAQLQNTINALNAQLGTSVSQSNAQLGTGVSQSNALNAINAALQGGQLGLGYAQLGQQAGLQAQQLGFQGAQNDASRFLQAVGLQPQIEGQNLASILSGTNALNQLGTQQQQTGQAGLNDYWASLNQLAQLLRIGTPGSTTTQQGTTTQTGTQTQPFNWGNAVIGGLGLAGKFLG